MLDPGQGPGSRLLDPGPRIPHPWSQIHCPEWLTITFAQCTFANRCLVAGSWHLASGIRYQVPGTKHLVGTRYQEPGWYQVAGAWYQAPEVLGSWSLVLGEFSWGPQPS